jgi:hypothetical protein
MGMGSFVKAAAALVVASGIAFAGHAPAAGFGSSDASAEAQEKTAKADRSRRVCRTIRGTGTRLSNRICRTQEDWDQSRDRSQEGLLEMQFEQSTNYEQAPRGLGDSPPKG